MSKRKTVVIEKNGVNAIATDVSLPGLTKRGWTVVETNGHSGDPSSSSEEAADGEDA